MTLEVPVVDPFYGPGGLGFENDRIYGISAEVFIGTPPWHLISDEWEDTNIRTMKENGVSNNAGVVLQVVITDQALKDWKYH